ncbi:MAG TPA: hypothetical protein VJV05_05305 [Pyrinomonadaceae bacterium]|nr:hypothetical protein [Pyrinomonadaceae bacterium]
MEAIRKHSLLSAVSFAAVCFAMSITTTAQTPSPTPEPPSNAGIYGNLRLTSSVELGVRGLDVNGDHDKYRSDLGYKPGFRIFDSSFLLENSSASALPFDTMLVQSSGWGSDPQSSFRLNIDRTGLYRFDSNVRRVKYFNNLKNHATTYSQPVSLGSQHRANTEHYFGDFDLTIFPERDLRFKVGYSFNDTEGPGTSTIRFSSDEYTVDSNVRSHSDDLRLGVEGKLLGFNLGLNYGHRIFRDNTLFFNNGLNLGNNTTTGSSQLTNATRQFDVEGTTDFVHGYFQRTFAKRFDISGRLIYSEVNSEMNEEDNLTGRASSTGNFIVLNQIFVPGEGKRPQTRGDVGATWMVTNKFRISNTFTFDQFSISGANTFLERTVQNTPSGGTVTPSISNTTSMRGTSYKRFANLIEGDYQFSRRFAVNVGYRYTNREVTRELVDIDLRTGAVQRAGEENLENSTNTFIVGTRIRPVNNWTIYMDLEKGESDNVFTRLANNDFFNFRIRTNGHYKQFSFNASFIHKDNESPGTTLPVTGLPATESIADTNIDIFSGNVDWTPSSRLTLSSGYTYTHQTTRADIIVPVGTPIFSSTTFLLGLSEYFVRDNYFFFNVHAQPLRRVSVYASYSISDDGGQGSRVVTRPQDIISGYPMTNQTPEIKIAFRLADWVDWNVGYQYYSYKDLQEIRPFANPQSIFPSQSYSAHMPYTSLRFYFGRSTDR